MIREKIRKPCCTSSIGSSATTFTIKVVEPQPPQETKSILLLVAAAAIGLFAIWTYAKRK